MRVHTTLEVHRDPDWVIVKIENGDGLENPCSGPYEKTGDEKTGERFRCLTSAAVIEKDGGNWVLKRNDNGEAEWSSAEGPANEYTQFPPEEGWQSQLGEANISVKV